MYLPLKLLFGVSSGSVMIVFLYGFTFSAATEPFLTLGIVSLSPLNRLFGEIEILLMSTESR